MQSIVKPLLRPLPLLGLSTGGLYLAATLSTSSRAAAMASNPENSNYRVEPYTPRHASWPYNPSDFTRQDSSSDTNFYSSPRFVTHIDDAAIASLSNYYDSVVPRKGRILDFCSSWISHYPPTIATAAQQQSETPVLKITGMGMNAAELAANPLLNNGRLLTDLNANPDIISPLRSSKAIGTTESDLLDASTCVVSIDYLTSPVAVLRSVLEATKPGGTVHLTISNRCFPTKAMSRWLRVDEEERLLMVGDYLHFAGWKKIEIVELSNGKVKQQQQAQPSSSSSSTTGASSLQGLFGWMGMNSRDPLWVVRATRED